MARTWRARLGVVVSALLPAVLVAAPAVAQTATAEPSPSPSATTSTTDASTSEPSSSETSEPSPTETSEPSPSETSEPSPSPSETTEPSPSPTETSEPSPSPTETSEPSPSPTETSEPSPTGTSEPSPSPSATEEAQPTRERRSLDVTRYEARGGDDGGTVVELDEDIEAMRQLDAPSTGPLDFGANDTIQPAALRDVRSAAVGDQELDVADAAAASSVRDRIPLGLLAAIAGLVIAAASIIANAALRRSR